jgi:Protein of unknown function (DUF3592)
MLSAVRFGIGFLVCALLAIAFAYFWHYPKLSETDGTIVASAVAPQMRLAAARNLKYDYSVDGKRYTGQSYIRYAAQYDSLFGVGAPIHVYFERQNPAASYVRRPSPLPLMIFGVIFGAIGAAIVAFAWSR